MRRLELAEIQGAAAMGQPAHDELVRSDDLLPVDAQVLARLVGAPGDDQAPGEQGAHVTGPAGLDGQARQIHVLAFPHHLLAGGGAHFPGAHVEHLLQHRPLVPGILQAARRFRLLQVGQQLADLAQLGRVFLAHAQGHPLDRAEQVGQHGDVAALRLLEQQGRPAGAQHPVADLGHFQAGIHLGADALEFAPGFQLGDEIAQVGVTHGGQSGSFRHVAELAVLFLEGAQFRARIRRRFLEFLHLAGLGAYREMALVHAQDEDRLGMVIRRLEKADVGLEGMSFTLMPS
jgi:hypothetical protein